ncbi:High-affnity carbon uptake protein Hat/HatR [Corallococcus sp. H22C18031201]|uniref:WD40 repeat domain-containing protein n=1 Tax=Citreicoccus inhibens TaxID=2849499 RepID=UPI000E75CA75|nr:WD40 repeat domain-containing protein [Citreicoccus inhibens]MBU8894018.1 WD40 repeat domain-containing protein [Citreicoccus inhibens]RJS23258.1 High-affnity carbon uptake protein Hat/HatR [Corallococcus sp. H22C18031201]
MPPPSLTLAALAEFSTLERLLLDSGLEALEEALDTLLARVLPDDDPWVSPRAASVLRRALALDADFVRDHPEALFQCLYNRLRWFDAPEAASHFEEGAVGPWSDPGARVWKLAEHWRQQWEAPSEVKPWLEALRPLPGRLEGHERDLRHEAHVLCVAFNPSGTRLATGSWEDTQNVHLWDVATGTCVRTLAGHEAEVRSVAWSPDGTRLASGSRDHDARIWDVETGALLHSLTRQEGQVTSVAFSPDGRWLAVANLGWRVRLVEVATGRVAHTLSGHEQSVLTVAFHPSGRWLASGGSDDTARIWDVETGAQVARISVGTIVRDAAFSPDGAWLALSTVDGVTRVETQGWTHQPLGQGLGPASSASWLDAKRLGVFVHGRLDEVDALSGEVLRTQAVPPQKVERHAAFHPDGERFALTSADFRVVLSDWNARAAPRLLAEQEPVQELSGRAGAPYGIARLRRSTHVFDSRGQSRPLPLDARTAFMLPWDVSPDGRYLACPLSTVSKPPPFRPGVRLLDARTLEPAQVLSAPPVAREDRGPVLDSLPMAFSPDGKLFVAAVEEERARVWRVSDGALVLTLRGPPGNIQRVSFTPDGTRVVVLHDESGHVSLHELRHGTTLLDTEAVVEPDPVYAIAARSPSFAVGRESGELVLLDAATGTQRTLAVSDEALTGLALSPDGTRGVFACADASVRVFDVATGAVLHALPHPDVVFGVAVVDSRVITVSQDQHTRFFDLASGALLAELPGLATLEDVVAQRYWETLGDAPVALHRPMDATPLVHFPDVMEETLLLQDGLLLARGHTQKDFLYVLRLHDPAMSRG